MLQHLYARQVPVSKEQRALHGPLMIADGRGKDATNMRRLTRQFGQLVVASECMTGELLVDKVHTGVNGGARKRHEG